MTKKRTGGFTLPGEAGYEDLTLELAKKWGADVIRDSDGTQLSDKIIESGYDIYSTLCVVRGDNEWAKANRQFLQQCCIMSYPAIANGETVTIELLKGYSKEQFEINSSDEPKEWWQVFDRTLNCEIDKNDWSFDAQNGTVIIKNSVKWHKYTVNFFAVRIWEEISAYNHITNNWGDREHLMPIDPIYPEVREHILRYLKNWLNNHSITKVVRLTSMFYNFSWYWSDDANMRFISNDWGAYEFTVSPEAIRQFTKEYGRKPVLEEFINGGLYNNSHLPPSPLYRDWIDFINKFVVGFGRKCIDLIHEYDKKAYVFYNDHWIGVEPYGERFGEFNFDGIIDGIFNGFECRKISGTKHVDVREIRLHPYLFPTGVNGAGTFIEGGNPTLECKTYWMDIRRALLRESVDRIGFGGYLHLVSDHPEFVDYIEFLANEFRDLKELHINDAPYKSGFKVAILSAWGNLRAWACCGHFNRGNFYNEVMESISGLPVDTVFISFEDIIQNGIPKDIKVIINAGAVGDSWSGGGYWTNPVVVERISHFVNNGGGFIGVGQPTSARHGSDFFQLSHILGVEQELGLTKTRSRYPFTIEKEHFITQKQATALNLGDTIRPIYTLSKGTAILAADANNSVQLSVNQFGGGRSVYMAAFTFTPENTRLLHKAIYWAAGKEADFSKWHSENPNTECAYYPAHNQLAVINLGDKKETTVITDDKGNKYEITLEPYAMTIKQI